MPGAAGKKHVSLYARWWCVVGVQHVAGRPGGERETSLLPPEEASIRRVACGQGTGSDTATSAAA
eukprot:3047275-Prymnesium_polylepis.1